MPKSDTAKATGIFLAALTAGFLTRDWWRSIMEDLTRVATLATITVLSIQMGLFFNWALLSLMLKAMNRVKPTASGLTKSTPTPAN